MSIIYKVSDSELANIRNNVFLSKGLLELEKKRFVSSPFSTSWSGRDSHNGFSYEMARLSKGFIQILEIYINRGDRWIQVYLNIFKLNPGVSLINELKEISGIPFAIPPNSKNKMRLRCDDFRGPPILNLNASDYKIKRSFTKKGFEKKVGRLGENIKRDFKNIDVFVEKWFAIYKPIEVYWQTFDK